MTNFHCPRELVLIFEPPRTHVRGHHDIQDLVESIKAESRPSPGHLQVNVPPPELTVGVAPEQQHRMCASRHIENQDAVLFPLRVLILAGPTIRQHVAASRATTLPRSPAVACPWAQVERNKVVIVPHYSHGTHRPDDAVFD
jgi:hypothetical protein